MGATRQPETRRPWRRWLVVTAMATAGIAGLATGVVYLSGVQGPNFERLVVAGDLERVEARAVRREVRSALATRRFFEVNLEQLARSVRSLGWVADARVRRQWPDTLRVELVEHVPAARWTDGRLIDTRGRVFTPGSTAGLDHLPRLRGPDGSEQYLLERFSDISHRFERAGVGLSRLQIDDRRAWELTLQSGPTVRLGRRNARERLNRFLDVVVPALGDRLSHPGYIDMRYTNGFAVHEPAGTAARESGAEG